MTPLNAAHRRSVAVTFALVLSCVSAIACTPAAERNDLTNLPQFHLSATPTLTLTDDSSAQRTWTRVSARRLANGDIAVSDEPAQNIRVYNRRGEFLKELTHRGSGPGEMDQMFRMSSIGDTIFALPRPMVMPVSIFVADKGFIESYKPSVANFESRMTPFARLGNNDWVVKQGAGFRMLKTAPAIGEFTADTAILGIVRRAHNADSSTVVWFPPIIQSWSVGAPMSNASPYAVMPTTFPLRGATLYTASGAQLWFVDAETGAISAYDSTGTLQFQRTLALTRKLFNAADVDAAKTVELNATKSPFALDMIRGRYDPKLTPVQMPLFSTIHAGDDGEVWLQRYEIASTATQELIVIARNGKPIGSLALAAGLRIQQIGKDFILALTTDSDGLESVVEYSIARN